MDVSYRWLRALAPDLTDTAEEVAQRLAMYGAPVDALVPLGEPLREIRVARVLATRPHPDADRLSLCEVDAGTGEMVPVVCGAPNVREGAFYPFAPVGASLPGGITIGRRKIRGQESRGMLCSARELGLGREHEGIMELHGEFTPGEPLVEALGLEDWRIEVDVTPNRPDLLSHFGIARELAPGGVAALTLPPFPDADPHAGEPCLESTPSGGVVGGIRVAVEDAAGCPRYIAGVVRGVRVAPSPEWLASRLRAVGLRPINNIVDATNYVLYELGQPLHAFDLARLGGAQVRVRRARAGERIVTLDAETRALDPSVLVIADAAGAVAVAGVMGGRESEVTAETTDVFLECALFDPATVRAGRRLLGLSTDASYRFERGVDPDGMEAAARRALALVGAVAGGEAEPVLLDVCPRPAERVDVRLRPSRVGTVLGLPFDAAAVRALLEPIGFEVADARDQDALLVRVPGHRSYDVRREIDLIEEVARRHGYEGFPDELRAFRPSAVPEDAFSLLEDRVRTFMVGRGFAESRTAAFAAEAHGDVALLNPLSTAESHLRRALLPELLRRLEHNFSRGTRDIRLFEVGTVFAPGSERPLEATHLAAAFTGARQPPHWSGAPEAFDVWDLKGLLEGLAPVLGAALTRIEAGIPDHAGPLLGQLGFRLLEAGGRELGRGGRIDAAAVDAPAWAEPVWGFELELTRAMTVPPVPGFRPLPAFPAIERDLALLVPQSLPAEQVEALVRRAAGPLLEALAVFDVYRGDAVPRGQRSIAYRLRLRAEDRTLTDQDADRAIERVLRRLKEELGVERRG